MAHTTARFQDVPVHDAQTGEARPGFFTRLVHALQEGQRLRAEREVARYIQTHGGALTDSLERELALRYSRAAR
ncbi:MAG TPA: hypothetical protein VFV47_07120 [Hyphomicrobiaceae bacterium]|nr:hypothetical protein [Hyphomicrobiaceae bacterium]